jgi:hypothetical protein
MSKPTVYGIFASALGAGYTDAEAARLEFLINEEIGQAGLQDRAVVRVSDSVAMMSYIPIDDRALNAAVEAGMERFQARG